MRLLAPRRRAAYPRLRASGALGDGPERGQALVEFVVVLTPLLLILVAIIQFGLLYGGHVTLTNAAREGARAGTIYIFDQTQTAAWNDAHRCAAIIGAATQAFGLLDDGSPHFTTTLTGGACPTPTGTTQVNGDVTLTYCAYVTSSTAPCPNPSDSASTCVKDTREDCLLQVTFTYRNDVIVPLIGAFLSHDASGRFVQHVTATMVVN